jgi:predicted negative regulator of RcsB-dependent stress response
MLRASVTAIDTTEPAKRRTMAEAHVLFHTARDYSKQQKPTEAERTMREAAAKFASVGHPMALSARFYAASARLAQNDVAHARPELETLLSEVQTTELGAEVRWELARCHTLDDDWAAALPLLDEAHARFARLGERANASFIDTIRAAVLITLGRSDEAWEARARAFEGLSREGREDRLAASIDGAAQFELRSGRRETALALLGLEESAQRTAANDVTLAAILVQKTLLNVSLNEPAAALRTAVEAEAAARRVPDTSQRARSVADAEFATAAAVLDTDPARARALLTSAIGVYRSQNALALVAEPFLLSARAALRLGDRDGAARDLDEGIAAVERKRIRFAGAAAGTGVLDAGAALYEDAVRLRVESGDARGAFAYAERARAADVAPDTAVTAGAAPALEARLAGTGVVVLELVTLPREVVAFTVTERGTTVARHAIAREQLSAITDDAKLYDALIRPSEPMLTGARALVIVADPRLEGVTFAALFDGRHHLIEKYPLALATSAASLAREKPEKPATLAAIALPSGDASETPSLPESDAELADIAHLYRSAIVVPEQKATFASLSDAADVLHISGHTERQSGGGDSALVLAGRERVSWKTIVSTLHPRARTVVLAACETLRRPNSPQARALSLGGAFLAAGAGNVVGTRAPIADADARAIFLALHRELAAGTAPAEALRRAQLASLASRSDAWRNVALLTSRVPLL